MTFMIQTLLEQDSPVNQRLQHLRAATPNDNQLASEHIEQLWTRKLVGILEKNKDAFIVASTGEAGAAQLNKGVFVRIRKAGLNAARKAAATNLLPQLAAYYQKVLQATPEGWVKSVTGNLQHLPDAKSVAVLKSTPLLALTYAILTEKPYRPGEAIIATVPKYALKYATEVIKGRFLTGEPAIFKLPLYQQFEYCVGLVNKILAYGSGIFDRKSKISFPEFNAACEQSSDLRNEITTSGSNSQYTDAGRLIALIYYNATTVDEDWPSLEKAVLTVNSSQVWITYLKLIKQAPWPELEAIISADPRNWSEYEKTLESFGATPAGSASSFTSTPEVAVRHALTLPAGTSFPAGEAIIATSVQASIMYARHILGRFLAGEPTIIAKGTPDQMVAYAENIIQGPWHAAEHAISASARASVQYARAVLKKPFPAGEPAIVKDAGPAAEYAANVMKKAWPSAEAAMLSFMQGSVGQYGSDDIMSYIVKIRKRVWPAMDTAVLGGSHASLQIEYAKRIKQGAWPELEKHLLASPVASVIWEYIKKAKRARWLAAEPILLAAANTGNAVKYAVEYASTILRARWPDLEKELLARKTASYALEYAYSVIRARWPELEQKMLANPDASSAVSYCISLLRGPWPAMENTISQEPKASYDYAVQVLKAPWPKGEPAISTNPTCKRWYMQKYPTRKLT